jgi:peptide/nickel transport system permease protein
MSTDTTPLTFERVDWDEYDATDHVVERRTLGFLGTLGVLVAAFLYHYLFLQSSHYLVADFRPTQLNWLSMLAAVVVVFYAVWPLAANRKLTRQYWRSLRARPFGLVAAGYLALFALVALVGPNLIDDPRRMVWVGEQTYGPPLAQPPAFTSVSETATTRCTAVRGDLCHGTLAFPLGTTHNGLDVLALLVYGSRTVFQIALITAVLLVPFGTVVGTAAAYAGGRVDSVLMRYVDLQQVIPAFLVYLLFSYLFGGSVFAMIVLFGLLDWHSIARQVRGDALRKRKKGYVLAARGAGSTHFDAVRRHLLPNVANTVVSAVTRQIPYVLAAVVTLTFFGAVGFQTPAWAPTIKMGLEMVWRGKPAWWMIFPPTVALAVTLAAFAVVGDAVREILDPRGESP